MPVHGCKDIYYRYIYKADSLKYSSSKLLSANSVFLEILLVMVGMSVVSYLEQVSNQNSC